MTLEPIKWLCSFAEKLRNDEYFEVQQQHHRSGNKHTTWHEIFGLIFSSTLADPGDESGNDPGNYVADKNADKDDEFSSSSDLEQEGNIYF